MMPGETLASGAPERCPDCGRDIVLTVCQSAAGYYVGAYCDCGPYCRETGYVRTREQADRLLADLTGPTAGHDPEGQVRNVIRSARPGTVVDLRGCGVYMVGYNDTDDPHGRVMFDEEGKLGGDQLPDVEYNGDGTVTVLATTTEGGAE